MSDGSGAADYGAGRPTGDGGVIEAVAAAGSGSEQGRDNTRLGVVTVDGQGTCAGLATSEGGGERTSLAEAPSDCNKNSSERVSAASAKARRSFLFHVYNFL